MSDYTIAVQIHNVAGHKSREEGLPELANALLLLTAEPALDEALSLAQDILATSSQQEFRKRALKEKAALLRAELAVIDQQLINEGLTRAT